MHFCQDEARQLLTLLPWIAATLAAFGWIASPKRWVAYWKGRKNK